MGDEVPFDFKMMIPLVFLAVIVGFVTADSRIYNGVAASVEKYPSVVQVDYYSTRFNYWECNCGGNILNSLYILSAAHCFHGPFYHRHQRRIRAGSTYRDIGGSIAYIVREYNHPSYDWRTIDGDITVLLLTSALIMSPVIQPASIPRQGFVVPDNHPVVIVGWGLTEERVLSPVLLEVTVFTVNRELCNERHTSANIPRNVTENMLCSGIIDVGGKGSCNGDSGGPWYLGNVVVGVVSWANGCASPIFPSVGVNVASYTDWIVSIAGRR